MRIKGGQYRRELTAFGRQVEVALDPKIPFKYPLPVLSGYGEMVS